MARELRIRIAAADTRLVRSERAAARSDPATPQSGVCAERASSSPDARSHSA
jgi:hypothetical protein